MKDFVSAVVDGESRRGSGATSCGIFSMRHGQPNNLREEMAADGTEYDFFVSYARKDNANGWIDDFIRQLQEEHRKYSGGREFRIFFDRTAIGSLDEWRHRIYEGLAASRLLVAFISPAFLASEWCRREWHTWVDVEIAKHVLSDGAAPIYIVEVPWLSTVMTEQEVARKIAELSQSSANTLLARDAIAVGSQLCQRQLTTVYPFLNAGVEALRHQDLSRVLVGLAKDLSSRSQHVEAAARSQSTIPPYNRRFVGRLEELTLLRERLHQGRTGVVSGHRGKLAEDKGTLASVHGLGGIGKTELAFTYAHAFAGLYPGGRFLVPCEGHSDLRQAMLVLDEIFRDQITDEQRKRLELHFAAIRDCLRLRLHQLGRILLILDNITDRALLSPEDTDQVRVLGPDLHLLATTRLGAPDTGLYDEVHWLTLGELSLEDSLRLFEKYRPFASAAEAQAAERIARRLGGFALCVEVVGAHLSQHPERSYASFLEMMGLTDLEQVDQTAEGRDVTTRRHNNEKRLGAILAPTLASLSTEQTTALKFVALLPADHIVLPWLHQLVGGEFPKLIGDAAAWQHLTNELVLLAVLTRGKEGEDQALDESHQPRILRCHRLVQAYVRGQLTTGEKTAQQTAVEKLADERSRVLQKTAAWGEALWELEPLEALARLWDETEHPMAVTLLNSAGFFWKKVAKWARAESLYRRALTLGEKVFGPENPNVTRLMSNLAILLLETNRPKDAEPLVRKALAIDERNLGPANPAVATHLNTLALLFLDTNRLAEAEPLIRRALAIDEGTLGPEHPKFAIRLSTLAQVLKAADRFTEAEAAMRRALAIDEKNFGSKHPQVAIRLNNLAMLLKDTNRPAEAGIMYQRALAITEQSFGPEHPDVATNLSNLGQLFQATGRLQEAEPLHRRALAIDKENFGPEHPRIAKHLNILALLLQATNRLQEADTLLRQALAIDEQSFGPDGREVATTLNNLAMLLKDANRPEEAEPLMRRALVIKEKSFGPNHSEVAICLHNLSLLLMDTQRWTEAELLMQRALQILLHFGDKTGREHPHSEKITENYRHLLAKMGFTRKQIQARFNEVARLSTST